MELQQQQNQIFTKRFISLFFTNMSVFFVFYGLVTTLPLYAINSLGRSDDESGLLVTVFLLSAILVRPFSGKLLDLYGKKQMLMWGISFYVLCTVLYLVIEPFSLLLALRFFQGIWFSIITTAAGSLAADIVPKNRKGAGLGYFAMSTNLAVVLGPFFALLLIQAFSYDVLFIVMSVVVLVGAFIALTIHTEDIPKPVIEDRRLTFKLHELFERKALPVASLAMLMAFSYASVLSFLSLYADQKGLLTFASYFYAVFAGAMILTRPFTGKIYDTYGPKYVILPAFIVFAMGLYLLSIAAGGLLFLLSAIFIGIGYGTLTTSFQTLSVQSTSPTRSGYATATYFTLFDIGIATGSYVFGFVAFTFSYEVVYQLSAVLLGVGFVIYYLVYKNK